MPMKINGWIENNYPRLVDRTLLIAVVKQNGLHRKVCRYGNYLWIVNVYVITYHHCFENRTPFKYITEKIIY